MNTIVWCKCRTCGRKYDEEKATAELKGFCSQACLHDKAYTLGYRKPPPKPYKHVPGIRAEAISKPSEHRVLFESKQVGSLPWEGK